VKTLLDHSAFKNVAAVARNFEDDLKQAAHLQHGWIDTNEKNISAAAGRLADAARLVIVATGVLQGNGIPLPEKTYRMMMPRGCSKATELTR
jgi:hypothetical protein